MAHYLILVKILAPDLFAQYLKGHLPTIAQYGGKIVFRFTDNTFILGQGDWDVIVIQEWPSMAEFERWWQSEEYRPWAEIRDRAAAMTIIRCDNAVKGFIDCNAQE